MHPKPVPAARMGRASRLTARKRIPNYSKTIRVRTGSSSSAAADDPPSDNRLPLADVQASLECTHDTGLARSSGTDAPEEATHAVASISQARNEGLLKTLASDSEMVKPDTDRVSDERLRSSFEPENTGIESLGGDLVGDVASLGSEDGSKDAVNLDSVPVFGSQVAEGRSVAATGTGNGKKKVVRKTVRVVKKVIKKRVPKRVLASDTKDQGLLEKAQDGLSSSNRTQGSNIATNGDVMIGNANVVDEGNGRSGIVSMTEDLNFVNNANVVEKYSEVRDEANITGEGVKELKFGRDINVLDPIVGEKAHDYPSGIGCMEAARVGIQFGVSVPERIADERSDDPSGIHVMDANIQSNEAENSVQLGNVNYTAESVMNTEEIEYSSMENQAKVCVAETPSMDIVDMDDEKLISCPHAGPEGENDEVLVVEKNENIERPEGGNGEMESNSIRWNELLLSGEMEALERRKRRKTEVFVGGLDKNTNEDDIRKVFNEVGEIVEVRLAMKGQTRKNKGFAFVRFATAAAAKKALEDYSRVEICGKQCGVVPVEGNDTIFLGNIDRNWKTNDVLRLLETAGIEKIDKVTVKADPKNIEKNRGFAFVEFETCRDAQTAFHKLQKKDAFGRNPTVKVEWAQPLAELDEQEILKVKSVYAEFLPSAWDEEKVKEYFKRFGEIENLVIAKDRPSSRRKDFAFITYTTRDAAITCIEAINREQLTDCGSKVKIAVSLAKPIPKSRQAIRTSDPTSKQPSKAKPKGLQNSKRPREPRKKGKPARSSHHNVKVDSEPSTTDELVQLLRQQALNNQIPPHPRTGPSVPDSDFLSRGNKRPYSLIAHAHHYVEPRVPPHVHVGSSYPITGPSSSSYEVSWSSFPSHPERPGFAPESFHERRFYPDNFQTMEQAPYHGNNKNIYRRY